MRANLEPSVIKNIVASNMNVSVEDMESPVRRKEFIKAKYIAMFCLRRYTDFSLARIGMEFNGKDHATVLFAVNNVLNYSKIYKSYRTDLNRILSILDNKADYEFEMYKNYDTEKS
jgi:chromosomal replication initiator protein